MLFRICNEVNYERLELLTFIKKQIMGHFIDDTETYISDVEMKTW